MIFYETTIKMFSLPWAFDSYLLHVIVCEEGKFQNLLMFNHMNQKLHYRFAGFLFLFAAFQANAQITVWPGDANNDGLVNNLDILNLGLGFGKQGNPRDSVSSIWKQEQVQPWTDVLPTGLNLGFTDCIGN